MSLHKNSLNVLSVEGLFRVLYGNSHTLAIDALLGHVGEDLFHTFPKLFLCLIERHVLKYRRRHLSNHTAKAVWRKQ
jgi:hypothetical protein